MDFGTLDHRPKFGSLKKEMFSAGRTFLPGGCVGVECRSQNYNNSFSLWLRASGQNRNVCKVELLVSQIKLQSLVVALYCVCNGRFLEKLLSVDLCKHV